MSVKDALSRALDSYTGALTCGLVIVRGITIEIQYMRHLILKFTSALSSKTRLIRA